MRKMKLTILSAIIFATLLLPVNSLGVSGKCFKGDCKNGQGTWVYPNGTQFVGAWKNGRKHGPVTLIYADGTEEIREYDNGIRIGKCLEGNCKFGEGLIMYSDESIYVGLFVDGSRHGQGSWSHPGGFKYEGSWEDDQIQGSGTFIYTNGSKYVGEVKNGRQHGQGILT